MRNVLLCNRPGFTLSPKAIKFIYDARCWNVYPDFYTYRNDRVRMDRALEMDRGHISFSEIDYEDIQIIRRDDPDMIAAVLELKSEAFCGTRVIEDFRIAQVPDNVDWYVAENDETGYEWVAQKHKIWTGDKIYDYLRMQQH